MSILDTQGEPRLLSHHPCAWAVLRNVLRGRHKGRAVIIPPHVPLSLCSGAISCPTCPRPDTGLLLRLALRSPSPPPTLRPGRAGCFTVFCSITDGALYSVFVCGSYGCEVQRYMSSLGLVLTLKTGILHGLCSALLQAVLFINYVCLMGGWCFI